jgi:hypothetical protein
MAGLPLLVSYRTVPSKLENTIRSADLKIKEKERIKSLNGL